MKRKLWIILALMAVICLLASAALAGSSVYGHTHSWQEIRRTDSTCTSHGKVWYRCNCGETKVEELPTKGHAYGAWEVTTQPTCEADGVKTHVCANCKRTETRAVDALGHDWDAGVTTKEPGYLNPGEITYTCTRCGATRTEEIIPKEYPDIFKDPGNISLMNLDDPLHILTQPVGGSIDRDGGSMQLTVEAGGGEPPYTYQWRMRYNGSWWSYWRDAENGTDSTLEVKNGNYRYYCKVYDNNGDYVPSDTVVVGWNLYIAKQPENTADCEMDPVILTCEAAGGVPFNEDVDYPYAYTWMSTDGEVMGYGPTLTVEHMGEYYCHVEDSVLNATQSKVAIVYEADPFECKTDAPVVELRKGQDYELWAKAYGGIAPYTGVWLRDGEEFPTQQIADGEFTASIAGDGSKEAVYTFLATDAMDDDCSLTVRVVYQQLKIAQQPEGGMLPEDEETPFEINIVMAEGEEPFTYYLTKNGESDSAGEGEASYDFKVHDPGAYSIHVEDAAGNWADSDTVTVLAYSNELTIAGVDFVRAITSQQSASLRVDVADGDGPYTYTLLNDGTAQDSKTTHGTSASFPIDKPGWYAMHIEDAKGRTADTGYMEVVDGRLRIIEQPKDVTIQYEPNVFPSATFTCKAEGYPGHYLSYQWEAKSSSGWYKFKWSFSDTHTFTESASATTYYLLPYAVRCIVYDPITGDKLISEEAQIRFQLKVIKAQINEGSKSMVMRVGGGRGPYTARVEYAILERAIEPARVTMTGGDNITEVEYRLDLDNTFWSYVYFTVTDARGTSVTHYFNPHK